jgi:carboxyl-terminal processing protease
MKPTTIAICLAVTASIFTAGAVMHARRTAPLNQTLSTTVDLHQGNRFALQGSPSSGAASADTEESTAPAQAGTGKAATPASLEDDTTIARVSAKILSQINYAHTLPSDEISRRMFSEYLDELDSLHLFFLQPDVEEFEPYRARLDTMLLQQGDITPANRIYARFLERFNQQMDYINQLLKTEKFTFTGDEMYQYDRKKAPFPKDIDEAHRMWRDRIRYEYLQEKLNKKSPEEIVKTLTTRYSRLAHVIHEEDNDDIFEHYLNALAHAYDPHSDYMGKSTLATFGIQMKLSFFGIGAVLEPDEEYVRIAELTPGGPAMKSGKLKPGDRIIAVAQGEKSPVDTTGMKINNVVDMIRGPKGTQVKLTVIPVDATDKSVRKTVVLTRDQVKLEEQEAKARLIDMPDNHGGSTRLGVITVPSFYADVDSHDQVRKSTTMDVAKLLKKLKEQKVNGVILDLRNNGGGYLSEAISLTGLFIKQGPVVQVRDSNNETEVKSDEDPSVAYDGPLIVMTNRLSASASEIMAGALQDYGRALIVGDTSTFGKGTVQEVLELAPILRKNGLDIQANPGALKLTIQKFYRASGQSTQLKGVIPDVILPSMYDVITVGEKSLDYPLPYDVIASAQYDKVNRTQPYLEALRKRSEARIATDPDFVYLRQEIDIFKQQLAQKTVSLNEEQRLKEKKEADARAEVRKKQLLARATSKEKVYMITLKQADLPGLPAPEAAASLKKAAVNGETAAEADPTGTAPDDKVPAVDMTLDETKRILADWLTLANPRSAQAKR